MSTFSPEIINRLNAIQNQVWQTVSVTVSESAGQQITFATPLTFAAKTSDLFAEFSAPMMVIQFAFAGVSENSQVVLIPTDTIQSVASVILNADVEDIDENIVADIRPTLEGIVQGVCLAIGSVKNETIVASGMTIRYQSFNFPPNLQRAEEIARVQLALSTEEFTGTATWLMDQETVNAILGIESEENEDEQSFPQALGGGPSGGPKPASHEDPGLDLLMDIPLEISVELGRVKMMFREIVELGTGSIIELEKLAGEPVDVMVNGRPVARGEVVVIEDNFGVRITEILNPAERLNRLGDAA